MLPQESPVLHPPESASAEPSSECVTAPVAPVASPVRSRAPITSEGQFFPREWPWVSFEEVAGDDAALWQELEDMGPPPAFSLPEGEILK